MHFDVAGEPDTIDPDTATCLYRVCQEALLNVKKHAAASRLDVSLRWDEAGVRLTIEDDGRGFDPDAARADGGLGLVGIEERVRLRGGQLSWRSAPGDGCRLEVSIA